MVLCAHWSAKGEHLEGVRGREQLLPTVRFGTGMKIDVAALYAVLLASAFPLAPALAQGPVPGQPYIQIPIPGVSGVGPQPRDEPAYDWERCEHLRYREHDIRDRLAYAPPYSEEPQRLEYQLHEVRDEREQRGDH
jgi:hypothetical protein